MINLTHEERLKFAEYCEQEAQGADAIAKQAEKLPAAFAMPKLLKLRAFAYGTVARHLRDVETQTIRGSDVRPEPETD